MVSCKGCKIRLEEEEDQDVVGCDACLEWYHLNQRKTVLGFVIRTVSHQFKCYHSNQASNVIQNDAALPSGSLFLNVDLFVLSL